MIEVCTFRARFPASILKLAISPRELPAESLVTIESMEISSGTTFSSADDDLHVLWLHFTSGICERSTIRSAIRD